LTPSEGESATANESLDWRCYRHPDREAGVKCRRCERPICPDCMISAPVGFQCRECVKGAPAVRTLRSLRADPYVTIVLIAVNVAVFLPHLNAPDQQTRDLGLLAAFVAHGDWWRIVTSGFLHFDLLHVGFNMVILWMVGNMLEPSIGRIRFGLVYAVSLLAGSLGVLLLDPGALTGGASGAVFGIMAATIVVLRGRGFDVRQTGLVGLLVINLLLSFRPGVSLGAHLGGMVGGAAAGWLVLNTDDTPNQRILGMAGLVVLGAALVAGSLWVASNPL
jgi:membrane associated rhomboid family serine protease